MSRLIDADELEKAIYKWMPKDMETWADGPIPPIEDLVVSIMMTIEEQPTVNRWIPVSERLPEEDGRYLCDWQGMRVGTCYFHNGHFRVYGEIKDKYVTAWMPLPKAYKGEKEQ